MSTAREPRLVIFDCDGVLVDSERLTVVVESEVLTEMGWALSPADIVQRLERGKPAPDLFLHAAHSMNTDPADCVVIEDSATGVRAAQAAGMHCFGFAGGLTPRDQLVAAGAEPFETMHELQTLLLHGHA